MQKTKIFIADDDRFWTALLSQMLKGLGYENISLFNNGNDCVNNLSHNPALVFLDYQMEDLNGLEVLKKIKTFNSAIGGCFQHIKRRSECCYRCHET